MKIAATIEMITGDHYKYEEFEGGLYLDRVLNQECPTNYGFIRNTIAGDEDPLDVFVLTPGGKHNLPRLVTTMIKVIGAFRCEDNGKIDDKILALVEGDTVSNFEIDFLVQDIRNYLETYKKGFVVKDYVGEEQAMELIKKSEVIK